MPRRLLLICPCTAPVVGSGSRFSRADSEAISRIQSRMRYTLTASALPLLKPRLPVARNGAGTSLFRAPVEDSCQLAVEFRREAVRIARLVRVGSARACAHGSGAAQPRRGTGSLAARRRRSAHPEAACACRTGVAEGSASAQSGAIIYLSGIIALHKDCISDATRQLFVAPFQRTAHGIQRVGVAFCYAL